MLRKLESWSLTILLSNFLLVSVTLEATSERIEKDLNTCLPFRITKLDSTLILIPKRSTVWNQFN
jgi:hypothetical protein